MPLNQRINEENVHLHNGVLLSGLKKKDSLYFAGEWMEVEKIILSEITQTQKDKQYVLTQSGYFDVKQRIISL